MALTLCVKSAALLFAMLPGPLALEPWWPGPPRTVEQWHLRLRSQNRQHLALVRESIARLEKEGGADPDSRRLIDRLRVHERWVEMSVRRDELYPWRPVPMLMGGMRR